MVEMINVMYILTIKKTFILQYHTVPMFLQLFLLFLGED